VLLWQPGLIETGFIGTLMEMAYGDAEEKMIREWEIRNNLKWKWE